MLSTRPTPDVSPGSSLAQSYGELAGALLPGTLGTCLFNGEFDLLGHTGNVAPGPLGEWLRGRSWPAAAGTVAAAAVKMGKHWVTVIALRQDQQLVGVFCVIQRAERPEPPPPAHARAVLQRLKACIDCLHRELAASPPPVILARPQRRQPRLVSAQCDLTTHLHTRDGLEQLYDRLRTQDSIRREDSLVYLDVDHLSVVNESHGFELGDELIVRIAELLAPPFVPKSSFAGRVAGDRFVLVLPDTSTVQAKEIASSIQGAVSRLRIGATDNPIEASVSCGIAALVDMPQGLARAIAAAEVACKMAKSHGRNRVELYSFDDGSIVRRQDNVVAVGLLRNALRSDALMLFAQRIEPLQSGDLRGGYEILLRFKGTEGQPLPPGALIEAASQYQLLPSVDRWVVSHALTMLAPCREALRRSGFSFSINISGQAIGDEPFNEFLIEQLAAADLPAGSVVLEITEQAAVGNLERANSMLGRLQQLGCRIALDDFGTGANSLVALKALRVGRVKIDGSFVRDILTEPRSKAAVNSILELARSMSLETVAEYVENDAIATMVRDMGVDYAQGYAFGKPKPLEEVLAEMEQGLQTDAVLESVPQPEPVLEPAPALRPEPVAS